MMMRSTGASCPPLPPLQRAQRRDMAVSKDGRSANEDAACGNLFLICGPARQTEDEGNDDWRWLIYNPATEKSTEVFSTTKRVNASVVAINGLVYVLGGRISGIETAIVEELSVNSRRIRNMSPMSFTRSNHGSTVASGTIVVCGGYSSGSVLCSCELFLPLRNTHKCYSDGPSTSKASSTAPPPSPTPPSPVCRKWRPTPTSHSPPSLHETIRAVRQLSSGKSSGSDAISAEICKHGDPQLMDHLTVVVQEMWRQGEVQQDFKDATIVHLYKRKGNRQICDNQRGISSLKIAVKILARTLPNRMKNHLERGLL
nr:unnamed protein product [Spirometra erinaceieuropaei]